jgi:hypothetical protein
MTMAIRKKPRDERKKRGEERKECNQRDVGFVGGGWMAGGGFIEVY